MTEGAEPTISIQSLSPLQVYDALRELRPGDVIGARESDTIDFKKGCYQLSEDAEKQELAKDVAAMANGDGGIIVRGIKALRLSTADEEVAAHLLPVPGGQVDVEQHRTVIRKNIYPAPQGVTVEFLPSPDESERGFVAIRVPKQAPGSLFLTPKSVQADGRVVDAIKIPRRDGAETDYVSVGELHNWASVGRRLLESPTFAPGPTPPTEPSLAQVTPAQPRWYREAAVRALEDVRAFAEWDDADPVLALVAAPPIPADFAPLGFYSSGGMAGALASPPTLRHSGFGLSYGERPQRVPGGQVVSSARDRVLWARENGLVLAATNARGDFLTWASRGDNKINPTVIVEYTFLFCKLVYEHWLPKLGGRWTFGVCLANARLSGLLLRGPIDPRWGVSFDDFGPAPGEHLEYYVPAAPNPEQMGFRLVEGVYDYYSAPPDAIPYTVEGQINPEALAAVR